jgi:hypothetical protein
MPTRRVDGVVLDWTCGCRLAIGVEMEPSYRPTNAYIDNDDWVVGERLTTQSPVDVWKLKSVHSLLLSCFLFLLLTLAGKGIEPHSTVQPAVDLRSIDSH